MYYQTVLTNSKLDTWIKLEKNVLLVGEHGVGKTSQIVSAFDRNFGEMNKDWVILSGANLDPWTDLIGVPKVNNESGVEYLDFIRPKNISDDIQAMFIDEFNRTHKSVRNALMELLQFKSINGRTFPNLKVVWAAINPEKNEDGDDEDDDLEYDVEKIDPAQKDRFHIIVQLPYKPSKTYFRNKFGELKGEQALKWWDMQPNKSKKEISPRRLDYAVEYLDLGGNVREVLPPSSNINKFVEMINTSPVFLEFEKIKDDGDKLKEFFKDENNYEEILPTLKKTENYCYCEYLPPEKISQLIDSDNSFKNYCLNFYTSGNGQSSNIINVIDEKIKSGDKVLEKTIDKIKKELKNIIKTDIDKKYFIPEDNSPATLDHINKEKSKEPTNYKISTFSEIYQYYNYTMHKSNIRNLYAYVIGCLKSFQVHTLNSSTHNISAWVMQNNSRMNRKRLILSVANTIINDYKKSGNEINSKDQVLRYIISKFSRDKKIIDNFILKANNRNEKSLDESMDEISEVDFPF